MTTLDEYTRAVYQLNVVSLQLDAARTKMLETHSKEDRKAFETKLAETRKAGMNVNKIESDMRWEAECKAANILNLPMPKRND